jgi:hypothetical protein
MQLQFQGLIVHARVIDPRDGIERQIAVLMAAPEHKPIVAIRDDHIDFTKTKVTRIGHVNGVSCYALKDCVTTNSSGLAKKVHLPSVPKLGDVSSGGGSPLNPKDSVKMRTPDPHFHAYVELPPGGDLEELDYFKVEVDFNGVSFGCIARTVRYDVSASSDVTFFIEGKELVVRPDAILYVQNASEEKEDEDDPTPPPPPHPHFPEYVEFWEPKATSIQSPNKGATCGQPHGKPLPRCGGMISLDVDCSNSQFP